MNSHVQHEGMWKQESGSFYPSWVPAFFLSCFCWDSVFSVISFRFCVLCIIVILLVTFRFVLYGRVSLSSTYEVEYPFSWFWLILNEVTHTWLSMYLVWAFLRKVIRNKIYQMCLSVLQCNAYLQQGSKLNKNISNIGFKFLPTIKKHPT